ncbi:MAG: DMT family transporter [candidate division NC10 bacterium]|nr:DMT family transporter [candidate division NC10 bacterium]
MRREELEGLLLAGLATTLFSTGAILVRLASALSPLEVTAYRLILGALFVRALAYLVRSKVALTVKELQRLFPIGLVAGLHFLFFIASLYWTTIAHSLTLTYTAPVFVTLLSRSLLQEPLKRIKYTGIAGAILGTAVLAGFEPRWSQRMLVGDLLALGSALCFGLYSVLGRRERSNFHLLQYAFWVYLSAGLSLLPFALATFSRVHPPKALLAVFLLALFPLALGHTLYNAALRRMHASYVNIIATQEVTGGILLGWLLLDEVPGPTSLLGAGITLAGIILVLL